MSKKYILKGTHVTIEPSDETKLWDEPWIIRCKTGEHEKYGWVSFAGEKEKGTVPISIELEKLYRNRGIGTEVLLLMTQWAFCHRHVYEIITESSTENDSYIHALEKAGYVYRAGDRHNETYSIIKQKNSWTGLYVLIGIVAGFIMGFLFSNLWVGMTLAILISVIMGASMEIKEKKERESVVGKKIK